MKIKVKLSDKTKEELRGLPGHTPTDAELISLITPLIPPAVSGHTPTPKELLALIKPFIPKDGETPSDTRLLKLIKPLIPKPKIGIPGKTPTKKELRELIQPLIPDPIPGQDGSPDTGEEIKDKINFDGSGKKIAPIHLDLPQITELIGGLTKSKADGLYVNITGDTMTGQLIADAGIRLNDSDNLTFGTGSDYTLAWVDAESALVFNDAGSAIDLRIETDTLPNAFFVDASTNRIGLNTNTPLAFLDVRPNTVNTLTWADGATIVGTAVYFRTTFAADITADAVDVIFGIDTVFTAPLFSGETVYNFQSNLQVGDIGIFSTINVAAIYGNINKVGSGIVDTMFGGIFSINLKSTASGAVTSLTGVRSDIALNYAGAQTNVSAFLTNISSSNVAGTATNVYGFNINFPTKGAAYTYTNLYGLFINDLVHGTNDYAIVAAGADTQVLWLGSGANNTDAANGIAWGLSRDTVLYRSAANVLATNDKLYVALELEVDGALNHDGATVGFYGTVPVTIGAALTGTLTSITHTAPGTPDYAIQDLTNVAPYGFVTQDEGNTVLSVIANLQTRVNQLEARLGSATGVGLFT